MAFSDEEWMQRDSDDPHRENRKTTRTTSWSQVILLIVIICGARAPGPKRSFQTYRWEDNPDASPSWRRRTLRTPT